MSAADSSVESTNVNAVDVPSTENTAPVQQIVEDKSEVQVDAPVVESTSTDAAETKTTTDSAETATSTDNAEAVAEVTTEVSTTVAESAVAAPEPSSSEVVETAAAVTEGSEVKTDAVEETATSTTTINEAPITETVQSDNDAATPVENDTADTNADAEPTMTKEERIAKAKEIFNDGKKFYLAGSYEQASEKLSEALNYGVEVHGEFAVENYNSYYFYGKSLLEVGRAEDDVLKTALKDMPLAPEENANDSIDEEQYGNPESLTEEERDEIKEQVDDALAENARENEKLTSNSAENKDATETEQMDAVEAVAEKEVEETKTVEGEADSTEVEEAKTEDEAMEEGEGDEEEEGEGDAEAEGEGEVQAEGEEEESEPTSIQAAWEILEVARKICDAQEPSKEWDLNKADVLLTLGECSIEDENYTQAVDDITVSLELYRKHMENSNRAIARTYCIMAGAYKLNDDFLGASEYYEKAKESLVAKIVELKAAEGSEEEKAKNLKEVEELEELVAVVDLKIQDAKDSAQQSDENIAKIKEQLGLNKGAVALAEKTDAPANDITNMVRKGVKRTAENSQTDESKRLKEINAAE